MKYTVGLFSTYPGYIISRSKIAEIAHIAHRKLGIRMLFLIGTGINGIKGLSIAAVEILRSCDSVLVEEFTSFISKEQVRELGLLINRDVDVVQRWFIEDGREILEKAKNKAVAIVTYGDPLIATTHAELRVRATRLSIETKVLHSASGISALIGETGLQYYKFGRTVTLMADPLSALTVYNTVYENLLSGNHSLVLTEYNRGEEDVPFFLNPAKALATLLDTEQDEKRGIVTPKTFAVIASRIGSDDQAIISGSIALLETRDLGTGPHSIVIPGTIHFVEKESLETLTQCLSEVTDNTANVRTIPTAMIERYAPKAKNAARQMREHIIKEVDNALKRGIFDVLDNAEYYIQDAERFLLQRKPELAVLSIGYAEGLIDSLRFQRGMNPWLEENRKDET